MLIQEGEYSVISRLNRNAKCNVGHDGCDPPQSYHTVGHNIEQRQCASGHERSCLQV